MGRESGNPSGALNRGGRGGGERRNTKRAGEMSEAAFLHKAMGLGFKVTKPWGDSERYDFVLDSGARLWRVQIKCTAVVRAGGYHIKPSHGVYRASKQMYTAEDIDVLAAHVVPLDVWYVVPVGVLGPGMSLRLYPAGGCGRARFEEYREGWDLFRGSGADSAPVEAGAAAGSEEEDAAEEPDSTWAPSWRPIWKPRIFEDR